MRKEITNINSAFTLAEVLITLTIIGVIAAITIPNLMQKWQDRQTISGVRQAYSIIDNAFKLAVRENGPVTDWDWPSLSTFQHSVNGTFVADKLIPYLKVQKYCGGVFGDKQCVSYAFDGSNVFHKYLNGEKATWSQNGTVGGKTILANGMTIAFTNNLPKGALYYWPSARYAQNFIGTVITDINGKKGPNQYGIDVFEFGYDDKGLAIIPSLTNTNFTSIYDKNSCSSKSSTGASCATWILLHNNVDYKYRDVGAEW